ncbi:ribosomal RNA large subunit methyltransferase I-like [Ylistrum balloti]|uniref:ribosomal RNA large subunit methyltransferase I-like n=1 Tax=Ylistrum balloti TaxID=509963 RepID=UPI002905A9B9|nr:ribosomal RNA large subunit methyltransferase I-like [Ylistrum balloti]
MSMIEQAASLKLKKQLRSKIEAGHPWVYQSAIDNQPQLSVGAPVRLIDKNGFVAWAIYDPGHPIAARVWSLDEQQIPDSALIQERLVSAIQLRQSLIAKNVEAFRLVHGEADGLPGWAIDQYRHILVVRSDGRAAEERLPYLQQAIINTPQLKNIQTIVHRRSRGAQGPRWELLLGQQPEPFSCQEYAWHMEVDVLQGQKTGWFVDQRENRRLVFDLAAGLRVANLFSYTGGFSLAAALGGATYVESVDISTNAIKAAEQNFILNGLSPNEYGFIAEDAFNWFESARQEQKKFDLVIIDPPSFAPNQKSLPNAKRAYRRLFRSACQLLSEKGLLAASSCSSHITMQLFRELIDESVQQTGKRLQILCERGAGLDHPVIPSFPEGHYLKFVLCRVR